MIYLLVREQHKFCRKFVPLGQELGKKLGIDLPMIYDDKRINKLGILEAPALIKTVNGFPFKKYRVIAQYMQLKYMSGRDLIKLVGE